MGTSGPTGTAPVLGRPSAAAAAEPSLRAVGDAATASWRAEAASTEWCALRAASATGVRHRLAGQATDDSFAWMWHGARLAVAVADGLGSAAGSGEAAQRAAQAAARAAIESGPVPARDAVRAGVEEANRAAEGGGATTLVLAVVDRSGEAVVGRVGDSTAFMMWPGGEWAELFDPPEDERCGTDTPALPVRDPVLEVVATALGKGAVLVLLTDGLADPWRDGPTTVAPAMVSAVLGRPAGLELARLADFSRHGCHDDRTIVCLWSVTGGESGDAQ